jgi:hypothetical protein
VASDRTQGTRRFVYLWHFLSHPKLYMHCTAHGGFAMIFRLVPLLRRLRPRTEDQDDFGGWPERTELAPPTMIRYRGEDERGIRHSDLRILGQ